MERTDAAGGVTVLLWCFPFEMRPALRFRAEHPDWTVKIRNAQAMTTACREDADRIFAGTYCYGRVLKLYEGTDYEVEEVWLRPEYRHEVHATEDGYQLYEREGQQWLRRGEPQTSEEDAWAILDEKELGLA